MRTPAHKKYSLIVMFLTGIFSGFFSVADAQIVTNWIAYNDHRPGPLIPPHVPVRTNWGTALRVTTYDMGAPADTTGNLTNFFNGMQLPVIVTFTRTNAPDDFGSIGNFGPTTNSPAGQLFFGICDLSNSGIVGVDNVDGDFLTITFSGLNPDKRYAFRGASARGGGYAPRWSVATINANGWIDAHITGAGSPGVITSNDFPANLGAGQAAWNSGDNVEGDVIGWDFIAPAPDGSFSIVVAQYVGPYHGGSATSDNYGYSFGAMLLAEVEASAPVITANPPAETLVEQNHRFSLRVAATGTPLLYQWYKQGVGAIPGATFATYAIDRAALSDSGNFFAVVYNPVGSVTSTVAHVTVYADTNAPTVASVYAYPVIPANTQDATLNQVTVEFDEPVEMVSATTAARYSLSGGGGTPTSAVATNDRTVVLTFASALTEDTAYTLTINTIGDTVGNVSGTLTAPFRTWVRGPGNGLLHEVYDTGAGVDVVTLTTSPVYPDGAYFRTNLWGFDTRIVFPDETLENFGSRTRGVFIPPVSGDWVFFLRTYDRADVYLNPNGIDPADKVIILAEQTGNEPRDWNRFISSPYNLRGGKAYYIEGLHKAQTGTNVLKVAARLNDGTFPTLGISNTEIDTNSIMGAAVGAPLAPRNLGGPLVIVQDLTDLTVEANHLATFAPLVVNASNAPVFYQWFRNNVAIPGATGPTYSFLATNSDSGSIFRVEMAKIGSTAASRTVSLTVNDDTTPPRALEAYSTDTNLAYVVVQFSEPINPLEGGDSFSYMLDGTIFPAGAVMLTNGTTAIIGFDVPLVSGSIHEITVTGVRDLADLALSPDPTMLTFTAGPKMPSLSITLSGNNVILTWPAYLTGSVLEQATALATPASATVWSPVAKSPLVIDGENNVVLGVEAGLHVYRLRR